MRNITQHDGGRKPLTYMGPHKLCLLVIELCFQLVAVSPCVAQLTFMEGCSHCQPLLGRRDRELKVLNRFLGCGTWWHLHSSYSRIQGRCVKRCFGTGLGRTGW